MSILKKIKTDFVAVKKNDPAAKNYLEIILCHTPIWAIVAYRFAHPLHKFGLPIIPRFLLTIIKIITGIEIHPGAKIGSSFFIDHGVGVVIGETAEIGNNCVLFHNVTLGGTGKYTIKRHPTIGNNVLIGTGATLLGPIKIGSNVNVGAESFVIMQDIPSNCTVVGVPARIVKLNGKKVNKKLPKSN